MLTVYRSLVTLTAAIIWLSFCAENSTAQLAISEIRIDQPGSDVDEYAELAGPSGQALTEYTYIVIGDGTGGNGVIEMALDLGETTIPDDGYALIAEPGFSLGVAPDLVATLVFENADNVTHLVATGFAGDVGLDLDVDDDGVLDRLPWTAVEDCLAILAAVDSGDLTYCETTVGPDGGSAPFHVYFDGGWQVGARDPDEGVDTPGGPPSGLPIEKTDLTGIVSEGTVFLRWGWASEIDVLGFRVRLLGNEGWRTVGRVAVSDRRPSDGYALAVPDVPPGRRQFELSVVKSAGEEEFAGHVEVLVPQAFGLILGPVFPNPTQGPIQFRLHSFRDNHVHVAIYDPVGRIVKNINTDQARVEPDRPLTATLARLPAGVYFVIARGRTGRAIQPVIRM